MKNKLATTVLTLTLLAGFGAATSSAQSLLNEMRIGSCNKWRYADTELDSKTDNKKVDLGKRYFELLVEEERKKGLVVDVRPFAINQATGKLSFSGNNGRVTVVNMNPFAYRYTVSVAQHELVSSALNDFLGLLLPAKLRPTGRTQSGGDSVTSKAAEDNKDTRIGRILARLDSLNCNNAEEGCKALKTLKDLVDELQENLTNLTKKPDRGTPIFPVSEPKAFEEYRKNALDVVNEEIDAYEVCTAATTLHDHLKTFFPNNDDLKKLNTANEALRTAERVQQELTDLISEFSNDNDIKDYKARCGGFKCLDQISAYATEAGTILGSFRSDINELLEIAKDMKDALKNTEDMAKKDGLFARTFTVIKRFEFTEASISVGRVKRGETNSGNVARSNNADSSTGTAPPKPLKKGGSGTSGGAGTGNDGNKNEEEEKQEDDSNGSNDSGRKEKAAAANEGNGGTGGNAITNSSTQSIQIGRPRFLLSGGLVFSPMERRTFGPIKGFAHDSNGNPTGSGDDNIIGLTEESPRRLLPMAILNTRIHSFAPTSFYFSLGVTAKHEDNVDIEYLLGPSVSLLNERALFTFGGYVGRVQQLVPDVKIGDKIPDSVGTDAKLFTKRYSWKPGFSFSYVFSESKKQAESLAGGSGGQSTAARAASDLKNEIRIGGIPFNFAMGLVYSSLEDQTYDEIVGFARDRQGNLTKGQNLTRIAGLVSDSDYRLIPMAMLHTRLLNFGSQRSLYFTTGVSGRKVDDSVKIEYLLGPSINLYRRKLFFTFGAFAGKRQVLGGDFFEGAALKKDQSVTTHDRYVWKPAFGFSYDMSRIFRRDSQ